MGLGPAEALVIVFIVVVLFGPTLVAFWLGYTVGKRRANAPATDGSVTPGPDAASADAPAPPATPAPAEPPTREADDD